MTEWKLGNYVKQWLANRRKRVEDDYWENYNTGVFCHECQQAMETIGNEWVCPFCGATEND